MTDEERQAALDRAVQAHFSGDEHWLDWHLSDYVLLTVHSSIDNPGATRYARHYLGNEMQPHKILGLMELAKSDFLFELERDGEDG